MTLLSALREGKSPLTHCHSGTQQMSPVGIYPSPLDNPVLDCLECSHVRVKHVLLRTVIFTCTETPFLGADDAQEIQLSPSKATVPGK